MATGGHAQRQSITGASRLGLGATLVALSGIGLVSYGIMFLIRNFTGFIELGLTPEHVGGTPQEIRAFSPDLYQYISHLQVAVSGFIIALGIAVIALAYYGIRKGERWALWTAFYEPGNRGSDSSALALPLRDCHDRASWPDLSGRTDPARRDGAGVRRSAQGRAVR